MNATERTIFEQFPFWATAPMPPADHDRGTVHVVVGCGTSFYLAQTVAAAFNAAGKQAIAVTGGEWWHRPEYYVAPGTKAHVIALSRSGESTETVRAAERSRAAGDHVTALTCAADSSLTRHADDVLFARTHAEEDVVMTSSASLMLLMGLRMAGITVDAATASAAEALLAAIDKVANGLLEGRTHFVFLGGGPLQGIAAEGALKLQEMSTSYTQAYPTLDYRHGPITLVDERTLAVLLYSPDGRGDEASLAREITDKGGRVLGIGGPGTVRLDPEGDALVRPLVVLPALQVFGERQAQLKGLDTRSPRNLNKVILLA